MKKQASTDQICAKYAHTKNRIICASELLTMHVNNRKKHKNARNVHKRSQRKPMKCNKSTQTNTQYV